jgi:hypothetical protein
MNTQGSKPYVLRLLEARVIKGEVRLPDQMNGGVLANVKETLMDKSFAHECEDALRRDCVAVSAIGTPQTAEWNLILRDKSVFASLVIKRDVLGEKVRRRYTLDSIVYVSEASAETGRILASAASGGEALSPFRLSPLRRVELIDIANERLRLLSGVDGPSFSDANIQVVVKYKA